MQKNGNLVVYNNLNNLVWSSQTEYIEIEPYYLVMQNDGNLVIQQNDVIIWQTNTKGKGFPPYFLVMQSDGNLVIYYDKNKPIWSIWTGII